MINTFVAIFYIRWMKSLLWYILFSFSKRSVFTFIIIKSKTKLCFSLSNIRSVIINFASHKVKDFFWVTVKGSTLNVKYFPTCVCCKSVGCIIWSHTWQVPFRHGSERPALSIFGNTALTRWPLRLLPFRNPTIGTLGKIFLFSSSGANKIWSSCNRLLTFWKAG